jgi:AAA+ ATPase superfamily predicted ATPase
MLGKVDNKKGLGLASLVLKIVRKAAGYFYYTLFLNNFQGSAREKKCIFFPRALGHFEEMDQVIKTPMSFDLIIYIKKCDQKFKGGK